MSPSRALDADSSEFEPSESEDVTLLLEPPLELPELEDTEELEFEELAPYELDADDVEPEPEAEEPRESPPEYPDGICGPDRTGTGGFGIFGDLDMFEVMLSKLDAASLAARERPIIFLTL